jgi:hypothetical protein
MTQETMIEGVRSFLNTKGIKEEVFTETTQRGYD